MTAAFIGLPRVLLAIPVYNEARSIDRVLGAVRGYVRDVLVIDDIHNRVKKEGLGLQTLIVECLMSEIFRSR